MISHQHRQERKLLKKSRRYDIANAIRYLLAAMVGAIMMHMCTFSVYERAILRADPIDFLPQKTDEYVVTAEQNKIILTRKLKTTNVETTAAEGGGFIVDRNKEEYKRNIVNDSDLPFNDSVIAATTERSKILSYKNVPAESLLPQKLFTVVGLESSGTTFVAGTLARALRIGILGQTLDGGQAIERDRESVAIGYSTSYIYGNSSKKHTEVQHVSLPWGGFCSENAEDKDPREKIIPVVYPHDCMTSIRTRKESSKVHSWKHLSKRCLDFMDDVTKSNMHYPPGRYFLNITSHFEWYHRQGVDMHLIIVVRDESISKQARVKHCPNPTALEEEEKLGLESITHAIDYFILNNPHEDESNHDNDGPKKRLDSPSTMMASGNRKVVVVSYEMLNRFRYRYLKQLYEYLGIDSSFNPEWEDGNTKYITKPKEEYNNAMEGEVKEFHNKQLEEKRELRRRAEGWIKQPFKYP